MSAGLQLAAPGLAAYEHRQAAALGLANFVLDSFHVATPAPRYVSIIAAK